MLRFVLVLFPVFKIFRYMIETTFDCFIEFDLFLGTPTRFYRRQGQIAASSSFRQNSENVLNPASHFPRKAEKRAHNFCSDSSKRSDLQNMRTRPLQVRNVTPLFTSSSSAFCFTNKLEARLFA